MQARERSLAFIVTALIAVWLLDALFIGPIMTWFDEQHQEIERLEKEAGEASVLVDRKNLILERWRSRHATGLLSDEQSARFKMQEFIIEAAKKSDVLIESVGGNTRPAQGSEEVYAKLTLSLSAQGSSRSLKAFITAIEHAPMAMCIERCELATRDSKKDQLELSAALSTLIVAKDAVHGRSVPEGTTLWESDAPVAEIDQIIIAAKPFLADRRRPVQVIRKPVETKAPTKTIIDPGTWAVVGITRIEGQEQIFLRHTKRAEELQKNIGDSVDEILLHHVENNVLFIHVHKESSVELKEDVDQNDEKNESDAADAAVGELPVEKEDEKEVEKRAVAIGYTFAGKAFAASASKAATSTAQKATSGSNATGASTSTGSSTEAAGTSSDAERQAILERLRNRRSRKDGK